MATVPKRDRFKITGRKVAFYEENEKGDEITIKFEDGTLLKFEVALAGLEGEMSYIATYASNNELRAVDVE